MVRSALGIFILASLMLAGCSRKTANTSSAINIRVPESLNKTNKTGGVGAMSAMPVDRKACYGVNVKGSGIAAVTRACGPTTGLVAGFVGPGEMLSIDVPSGPKRDFELYAFLQDPGEDLACSAFLAGLTASGLSRIYLVGGARGIDLSGDVVNLEITAEFPGVANNLVQQLALPVTCTAGDTGGGGSSFLFNVSSDQREVSGTGLKMIGRVGKSGGHTELVGSGLKIITQ